DRPITRSAIGNDVGFADDAGALHVERFEDSLLKKVSVELASNFVDQNPERGVTKVCIAPLRARWISQRNTFDDPEHLVFGVVFAEVERLRVIGKSRSVAEEFADCHLFPCRGSVRKELG